MIHFIIVKYVNNQLKLLFRLMME